MRAYYFGNMYLSSIQQGIQAAHATADIAVKYSHPNADKKQLTMFLDWAEDHQTMILLNGGYSETINGLLEFFALDTQHPYPFAPFYESDAALDGALTTVGIILPEKIYVAAALARPHGSLVLEEILENGELVVGGENNSTGEIVTWEFSKWEYKMVEKLNQFGLAS